MESSVAFIAAAFFAGMIAGGVMGWLFCQNRSQTRIEALRVQLAHLEGERRLDNDKAQWLNAVQIQLQATFELLANKSLQTNAEEFLKRASERVDGAVVQVRGDWSTQWAEFNGVINPLKENLAMLSAHVRELEQKREGAYQGVHEQLRQLAHMQATLQTTTTSLTNALKSPNVRGRWGELQLRRVVEMAGMVKHVHFLEQASVEGGRPDLISYLPNQGILPVDAKTPLSAYLEAIETQDEIMRRSKLGDHVKAIRNHVTELSKKQYWEQFANTPDFVVMFVPNEACLHVAYEYDPELLEYALTKKVLITTPITLLALLRTVAYGWQQHQITENAQQIAAQGNELYKRLGSFVGHLTQLGTSLDKGMQAYNKLVGSFDGRLLPAIRKLEELGVAPREFKLPETIAQQTRMPQAEKDTK